MAEGTLGKLKVVLKWDGAAFQKGLDQSTTRLSTFANNFRRVSDTVNRVFVRAMQAGTVALGAFGAASVKVGSDFEQAMAFVGATATAIPKEMAAMEKEARKIGATTLFTARQAAQGMTEFARAGFTAGEIISATRPAMLLAGATMSDMNTAAQSIAASLQQFGLEASQSGQVADIFATATRNSLFTLQGLHTAMKYGGPQARAYGLSIEEATAAMMEFRNLGLEAHQAGVYFRMMLARTGKITPEAARELKKYGLEMSSISLKTNNFAGVLKNLADANINMEGSFERIFGLRAGPIVKALVENMKIGKSEWASYTDMLKQSAGSTEEMYARVMDTVAGQFRIVKSAFEELMIMTFFTYGPALKEFLTELASTIKFASDYLGSAIGLGDGLNSMLTRMTAYLRENQLEIALSIQNLIEFIEKLIRVLAFVIAHWKVWASLMAGVWVFSKVLLFGQAIMALLPIIQGMVTAFTAAGGAAAGFWAIIGAFTGVLPLLAAVAAGVAAITAALWFLSDGASDAKDRLSEIYDETKDDEKDTLERYKALGEASKNWAANLKEEMINQGKLAPHMETHIKGMESMTTATMAAGVASGKYYEVEVDGKNIMLSSALAWDMKASKTTEGIAIWNSYVKAYKVGQKVVVREEKKIQRMESLGAEISRALSLNTRKDIEEQQLARFKSHTGIEYATWEVDRDTLKGRLESLKEYQDSAKSEHTAHARRIREFKRTTIRQGLATANAGRSEENKAAAAMAKKRLKAAQRTAELEEKLWRKIDSYGNDGLLKLKFKLEEEVAAIRKTFGKELALYQKHSKQWLDIQKRMFRAMEVARYSALLRSIDEFKKYSKDASKAMYTTLAQANQDSINQREFNEEQSLKRMFDERAAMFTKGSANWVLLEKAYWDTVNNLRIKHETELRARRIIIERELGDTRIELEKQLMNEIQRIDVDAQKTLADLIRRGATKAQQELHKDLVNQQKAFALKSGFRLLVDLEKTGMKSAKIRSKTEASILGIVRAYGKRRADLAASEFELKEKQALFLAAAHTLSAEERMIAERELANDQKAIRREKTKNTLADFKKIYEAFKKLVNGMIAFGKKGSQAFTFFTNFEFNLKGLIEELNDLVTESGRINFEREAKKKVTGMVDMAIQFMETAVQAIPFLLDALAAELPRLFSAFMTLVPQIIQGFVANFGQIVTAILGALPGMITALLSQLPDLIQLAVDVIVAIVAALPDIIQAIVAQLPTIITALVNGLVDVIDALMIALPDILMVLVNAIGPLLKTIAAMLPVLIPKLIEMVLFLVITIIEQIPVIIAAILEALPEILKSIFDMIPIILTKIANALPDLLGAITSLIPLIFTAVLENLWPIIMTVLNAIFNQLLPMALQLVIVIIAQVARAIFELFEKIGQAIGDIFRSKKGKEEAKEKRAARDDARDAALKMDMGTTEGESLNLEDYYSGINYVPSNMRVNVHQGEAIIPADRNPYGTKTGPNNAFAGGGGGAGSSGQPIEIAIMAEGRLLDAVQITALNRGNAPGIANRLTRASGVTVGVDRGRFDYWTK